ncbi:hypothetical protein ACH5RR_028771 [Cinchona calisaya]|uniref:Uncharacterized protein n=1 Tax=Cinchona calisaya TaxID=153742 RepID=A0ABD2YTC7_9GENT
MHDVKALVTLASTVTVFVYNHRFTLNWLRKSKGWKEIIRPGETRFAMTLKSLHDRKDNFENHGSSIRLLRICVTDEKPSMRYVYEGEIAMFRDRDKSFGRKLALTTSRTDRLEEPNGELDYDELEVELEELLVDDVVECFNSKKVGDDEDDDKIG